MKEEAIVSSQASTLGCVLSFAVYIILIDCVLHCLNNSVSLGLLTEKKKRLFYTPNSANCPKHYWNFLKRFERRPVEWKLLLQLILHM